MVKPGGDLLYVTCSILPSENNQQIKDFLTRDSGKEFSLQKEEILLPSKTGFDGFYMALLKKKS
jgi:16S rRNA (cytosine967-C5)-methyltransferase